MRNHHTYKEYSESPFKRNQTVYLHAYARGNAQDSYLCKGLILREPYKGYSGYKVVITAVNPKPVTSRPNPQEAKSLLGFKLFRNKSQMFNQIGVLSGIKIEDIQWMSISDIHLQQIINKTRRENGTGQQRDKREYNK